ncbi:SPFH domain-containing protein [Halococcoides cellulosivorans]|uniref:Band 7 domain-containing protein n=1 Tax=Halococcoides cellulosivorans TaxID=1679096 RepID=A0A2R4X269_9EURY|nr:SPFH domain-containing protein [Halococcoides cellulosivorans]AWB27892.1 hypothetical protein HARCEL1_09290 [Halococcoides cellulosivorans]
MNPLFLAGIPDIAFWGSLGVAALVAIVVPQSLAIIETHENGAVFVLGRYRRILDPGVHLVVPFVSTVERIDMRMQTLEFEEIEARTQDSCEISLDASVYFVVSDPEAAVTEIPDTDDSVAAIAETCVRSVLGEHTGETVATDPVSIQEAVLDELDDAIVDWGFDAEHVEIENVDVEQLVVDRVPVTESDDD